MGKLGKRGNDPNYYEVPISGQTRQFPISVSRGTDTLISIDQFGGDIFEKKDFDGDNIDKSHVHGANLDKKNSDGLGFVKLFVGLVPKTATEKDIRPAFEKHGNVVEVALIKDKRTGKQQGNKQFASAGCCFIKYATSEEADRAIHALHNQYTLPGGVTPIQVRYADGERERLGRVEFKLFVGSVNKLATEKELEKIFLPYGRVEDVYLMRDESKRSRGCGFVKFSNRDVAMAAINALNGIYKMRGCEHPLVVRFADPKKGRTDETRGATAFGSPGLGPPLHSPGVRPSLAPIPLIACHPMNQHGMAPSSSSYVGMHGFGIQLAPTFGDGNPSSVPSFYPSGGQNLPLFKNPNELSHHVPSYTQLPTASTIRSPAQTSSSHVFPSQSMFGFNEILPTNTNTPSLSLQSFLEKDKLIKTNFLEWYRNLRNVLKCERKLYVLDIPIPYRPDENADRAVKTVYENHVNDSIDVGCLMLATMSPEVQNELQKKFEKNLELIEAYEMIVTLTEMFQQQARQERYETTKALQECKMAEGASVSTHVMKMKRYIDHLDTLGFPVSQALTTDMILNSLPKSYEQFVMNYTMNNAEKSFSELHMMLKTAEKSIIKTNHFQMGRKGKVTKISEKSKKIVKKVKDNVSPKEEICFHCNEVGHWKRNCKLYLKESKKQKFS